LNPEEDKLAVGEGWSFFDMARPFEGNVELKMHTFDDDEGKETFWHSSAHVLGGCLEDAYGVHLCHGPPTDSGFFYDSYTGDDNFTDKNYKSIED
jgi:threonyl-tRNA synthetase